jgi:RimJ/RimL family protein N-acetyltransferase
MKFLPLDRPDLIALASSWLSREENWKWLDFGGKGQPPTPALVKIMTQLNTSLLRVFTADDDVTPIGVVGLTDIHRQFKTASVWVVLGEKSYARHGYATRAYRKLLTVGFRELGLEAITSWAVEHNVSLEIGQRANFHFIGRQRRCHWIDGKPYDRLLFDLLASEHQES